jgi:hypothetical protein
VELQHSASPALSSDDLSVESHALNAKDAKNIFIVELCTHHLWPSQVQKNQMVREAITQANARARNEDHEESSVTKAFIDAVSLANHI